MGAAIDECLLERELTEPNLAWQQCPCQSLPGHDFGCASGCLAGERIAKKILVKGSNEGLAVPVIKLYYN